MTAMFGVNDTGWSTSDPDKKIDAYRQGLQQYVELSRTRHIPLLLLRETHFSHNKAGEPFVDGQNAILGKLFAAQDKLAWQANFDALTGLANRHHFWTRLQGGLRRASIEHSDISLCLFDVDHFKFYNDLYGHLRGDGCLRQIADAARQVFRRSGDTVARFGGEEFAIVFSGREVEDVAVYLDRMRRLIEQSTFVVRGKERRKGKKARARAAKEVRKETSVTVSIGVASSNGERLAPAEVLRAADQALYRAKARGRNCTVTARSGKGAKSEQPSMRIVSVS